MKKITLLSVVFSLLVTALAAQPEVPQQLQKGNLLLAVTSSISMDGSWGSEVFGLAFSSTKSKHGSEPAEGFYKCTVWNLLPRGGYFIMDNLAVGLEFLVSGYSEKHDDGYDTWKESTFGAGPYIRYYYPLDRFYPFAEVEVLLGTEKESYNDSDYKYNLFMLGTYLGVSVPLGERVAFDIKTGYARVTSSHQGTEMEDYDHKYITGGFVIAMGFSIYLPMP